MPVRATVSDFGPELLAKVLESNETQEQTLSLVFRYADEKALPLLDLSDLRALLTFLDSDAGQADLQGIGGVSSQTIGVLLRALAGLEDGGGNEFFGEPQLAIEDLMRVAPDGRGVISCVELPSVQDRPQLFSTALMWMVAELFEQLPEAGDLDKPKLVFFFEEAHLLFADATEAFLESVVRTVRMIRSKGVGIFFVTQIAQGRARRRARPARQPRPARAARLHARRRQGAQGHRRHLPHVRVLRPGGDPARSSASARPWSRSSTRTACPRPWCAPACARPRSRMGPADDVDARGQGVAAVRQVRRAGGRPERARDARRAAGARLRSRPPAAEAEAAALSREAPKRQKKSAETVGGGADAIGDFLTSREGKALQRKVQRGVFKLLRKAL